MSKGFLKRPKIFALIGAASVGALGVYYGLARNKGSTCTGLSKSFTYEVNEIRSWRPLGPDGDNTVRKPHSATIEGRLHIAPESEFRSSGQSILATFELKQPATDKFSTTVQLQLNEHCRIDTVVFDGRTTFSLRRTLQRFFATVDLGLAKEADVEHEDEFGLYTYSLSEESGRQSLRRTKLVRVPEIPARLRHDILEIKASEISFEGTIGGIFAEKMEAAEQLVIRSGDDKTVSRFDYRLTISSAGASSSQIAKSNVPPIYQVKKRPGQAFSQDDRMSSYEPQRSNTGADGKTFEQMAVSFVEGVQEGNAKQMKWQLIDFLRKNPDAYQQLRALIAAEAFSDDVLVHVLQALAKSGDAASIELLTTLVSDEGVGISTRLRVLFAANDVRIPTPELVAAVRSLAKAAPSDEIAQDALRSTSVLSSGILARNTKDLAPSLAEDLKNDIASGLQQTDDPNRRADYIAAAANAEFAEFGEDILRATESTHDVERKAAYEALLNFDVEGRSDLLVSAAQKEPQASNRMAIARSLGNAGFSSGDKARTYAQSVARESDPIIKAAGVSALAKAAGTLPEAKAAVLDQVKSSPTPEVLAAAGRYLGARELAQSLQGRRR